MHSHENINKHIHTRLRNLKHVFKTSKEPVFATCFAKQDPSNTWNDTPINHTNHLDPQLSNYNTHTGRNSHLGNATEKHLTQIFTIFNTNKKRETHWYLQRKTKCKRGKQLFTTRKRTQKSVSSTRKTKSNKSAAKQSQKGVNTKIKTTHKHTHTHWNKTAFVI